MSDSHDPNPAYSVTDDATFRFPSLVSMRAAHSDLLKRHRESGNTPELLAAMQVFIRQGQATGALLDREQDRWTSQSLLDYWATMLYRAGTTPPEAALAEFDEALAPRLPDEPCPYQGLEAFREAGSGFFFGRERLVDELVERLQHDRLLALVGSSGSGKSSIVFGGLLPKLKAGVGANWRYLTMVPGAEPLANLAFVAQPLANHSAAQALEKDWQRDPSRLAHLADQSGEPVMLVVDQFEEAFTLCTDDDTRRTFVGQLIGLAQSPHARHLVILTMRTDFVDNVAKLPELKPLFDKAQVDVRAMGIDELRAAIERPAEKVGLMFGEGIVNSLIEAILGEQAGLPLLQFTLLKLWNKRQRNRITKQVYDEVGDPRTALGKSAETFYASLIFQSQQTARLILLKMVRPGEGREFTSNRIPLSAVFEMGEPRDRVEDVLHRLIFEERLVKLSGIASPDPSTSLADLAAQKSEHGQVPQIEVAHEALVRNWPRLVAWLDDEREKMRQRLRLTEAAEQWATMNRAPEVLLRGALLDEVLRYQDLNELETEFVSASQEAKEQAEREKEAARQRELEQARALAKAQEQQAQAERLRAEEQQRRAEQQARSARRLRRLALALGIVFLLAAAAATLAYIKGEQAQLSEKQAQVSAQEAIAAQNAEKARRAEAEKAQMLAQENYRLARSRELAAAAINDLDVDPERSILLAVEAVSVTHVLNEAVTLEAENALHQAILASRAQHALSTHTGAVSGVTFSQDGKLLATASADKTVKVWETISGQELQTLSGHTVAVNTVAFSPEGEALVTAGSDGRAIIWDTTTTTYTAVYTLLHSSFSTIHSVAFSPDGKLIATAGSDGRAIIWDTTTITPTRMITLSHSFSVVNGVAFSPDSQLVATASSDRTARVWDLTSSQALLVLSHTLTVNAVAFSPDGTRLATASSDRTAKIWDAASGKELLTLASHTDIVNSIAFSFDGKRLATASTDRTVKVWDATFGRELFTLAGHTAAVNEVAFSPDGTHLASASAEGTAKVWDITAAREWLNLSGHMGGVTSLAVNSDGTRLATSSTDKTARVWNIISGRTVLTLSGHTGTINQVTFSPAERGKLLATASADGTAKVWDAASGQDLVTAHAICGSR